MLDKTLLNDGTGGYGPLSGWIYSRFLVLAHFPVLRTT